jgi:hypothetical protein
MIAITKSTLVRRPRRRVAAHFWPFTGSSSNPKSSPGNDTGQKSGAGNLNSSRKTVPVLTLFDVKDGGGDQLRTAIVVQHNFQTGLEFHAYVEQAPVNITTRVFTSTQI